MCDKIVDLPKKLLEKKIIHCVECKASVHMEGKKVDLKIIEEFYGKKPEPEKSEQETDWQRIVRKDNEKKAAEKQKRLDGKLAKKAA